MEEEIIRRAIIKGIQAVLYQINFSEDEEYFFAQKAYSIIKEFASLNPKQHPSLGLTDFLINNAERLFKSKIVTPKEHFSKFISFFTNHRKSGEILMYREMFLYNINIKTANIFYRYFLEVMNIIPHLYSNKNRLFKHVRLDTLKAKDISSFLLKKEISKNIFSQLFLHHMEDHLNDIHRIEADALARYLIQAYFHDKIASKDEKQGENEIVLLDWNSNNPNVFEIQIQKGENGVNKPNIEVKANEPKQQSQVLEQINADFTQKKQVESVKAQKSAQKEKEPKKEQKKNNSKNNLVKICHPYVLEKKEVPNLHPQKVFSDEYSDLADFELNKELEKLRNQLDMKKAEMEMEKNIWKLVLTNSKGAIKNYTELKKEITITEGITDALLNVVEKGSDDWKKLYDIKSNDVEDLYKYKFLIAALLEHCSQDLNKDIEGFKFAHDELPQKFNRMIVNSPNFDLNDYLTNAYRTNKLFNTVESESGNYKTGKSDEKSPQIKSGWNESRIHAFNFVDKKKKSLNQNMNKDRKNQDHDYETLNVKEVVNDAANPAAVEEEKRDLEKEKRDIEKEQSEIKEMIENQEVDKLRRHMNKLKRELVFAPKKTEPVIEIEPEISEKAPVVKKVASKTGNVQKLKDVKKNELKSEKSPVRLGQKVNKAQADGFDDKFKVGPKVVQK